jgi:hypothetical protein
MIGVNFEGASLFNIYASSLRFPLGRRCEFGQKILIAFTSFIANSLTLAVTLPFHLYVVRGEMDQLKIALTFPPSL